MRLKSRVEEKLHFHHRPFYDMNCFSHLCYFPNTNGILKWQMGIFWVDYATFSFFLLKSLDSFGGQPNDAKEEKNFFDFSIKTSIFSFCVHQTTIGQNQHHIHTCRKFLISLQQRVPKWMQTLGTWRATEQDSPLHSWPAAFQPRICTWKLVPVIRYCQPSPGLFKLGFGKSTNGVPA